MISAIANEYFGSEVVNLLLQHRSDIEISEEVLESAVSNWNSGSEIVDLLLQHQSDIESATRSWLSRPPVYPVEE